MGESPASVQAPRTMAVTGYGEGVNVVQFQRSEKSEEGECHDIARGNTER